MQDSPRIAVIGLGYVGLPLAVALARHFPVTGFDINAGRIAELRGGRDSTREVTDERLRAADLALDDDPGCLAGQDLYLVTVPTPVGAANEPDLRPVLAACETVGKALAPGAIVVFESTVYPGVTEDLCGPALEKASGLAHGVDFRLGYSPERMNPGDTEHTVEKITKVVAGETPEVAALLERVYGTVNGGDIFVARDIRTAEAAKVIENAQRDINIAFVNEVAAIFQKLGLSVHDVLEAARTKWNFLPFRPGLVGGHCIGVDPYYLSHCAQAAGHDPQVILSGRRINDGMAAFVAGQVHAALLAARPDAATGGRILVLGLTFKEDVPDLRNTKVLDLVLALRAAGHVVAVHDPLADPAEARDHYAMDLLADPAVDGPYDAIIITVGHAAYRSRSVVELSALLKPSGLFADMHGFWRKADCPDGVRYWSL